MESKNAKRPDGSEGSGALPGLQGFPCPRVTRGHLVSIHRPRRLLGHGKVCRSILTGVLELDCALEFDAARTEEDFFPALPAAPAVCLLEPRDRRAEPFLIRTQNLQRRLQRLLGPADPASKRLNLRDFASGIRYRLTGSRFEQTLTFYQQARQRFPERYRNLMRLRPPTVLKVNLPNAYPRCYVTRKILLDADGRPAGGSYYGPFPSRRAAEAFAERILDFFKVRRCQIKIRRDPTFPGCIYSEMKMCLAPCFSGCTKQEYDVEVNRLVEFLETSGGSLRTAFEQERERASEQLDFERARAMHKRVEKLDEVLRGRPEITRPIQDLRAVILQRTAEEQTIGVFAVAGGRLAEPSFVRFGEIASQPRSAEQIFRDCLESAPHAANGDLSEDLSLVSRWFYSKPREGEIFFREKDWPYRRILRACSRLLARAEGEPAKSPAPRPRPSPEGAS
jgi:excinuclease ABC subunit C